MPRVDTDRDLRRAAARPHFSSMARGKAKQRPAATAQEDNRPINARGETWQAVKLTGARAQKGKLASGAPRYTYEVEWSGADQNGRPWKNT